MDHAQIFIFTGPTISPEKALDYLDAIYLPPVKYGDVYRVVELFKPRIIGIIDGYFNQVPSVWHKEILWAMSQGITVLGAASMGALRAAELDQMGMIGCGKIYRAYQSGILPPFIEEPFEDDDEVAIVHSPPELGYIMSSEAMVNIRFSFARAVQRNVIDRHSCLLLTRIAKNLFYADRNYPKIFEIAKQRGLPDASLKALSDWIGQHAIDQKQLDAITLLEKAKEISPGSVENEKPGAFTFQHTAQWQTAIDEISRSHHIHNPVLNELRLKGPDYFNAMYQALTAGLGIHDQTRPVPPESLSQLHRSPDTLQQVFSLHWQQRVFQSTGNDFSSVQREQLLLNYLKHTGEIDAFTIRAQDKKAKLDKLQQKPDVNNLSEIECLQLTDWYFAQQLGLEMPDQIEDYCQQLGIDEIDSFYDMILKEYLYLEAR